MKITLENYWTGALLEEITLTAALKELDKKTHPTYINTSRKELRKAFRDDDGRAVFAMLRT